MDNLSEPEDVPIDLYIQMNYTKYGLTKLRWSSSKSEELKRTRGVSFEEIVAAKVIAIDEHPTRPNQSIILFEINDYIWAVPCVMREGETFLKTLFPSRKHTKIWRRGELT